MCSQSVRTLSEEERLARLALSLSEHVGPITFRQLVTQYGSAQKALKILPDLAARGGKKSRIKVFPLSEARQVFDKIKEINAFLIVLGDPEYPEPLEAVEDAPPFLVARGNKHLLEKKTLAIVGARNASANGRKMSEDLAAELGKEGFLIASGLARGIDTHAHLGSLETGTVAVLGGGIDVYYPKENRELQDRIGETGILLSEHLPGTKPQAQHFPRRNRIISGLSLGVTVVEAAIRSGSLITARLALEQGREVFAVPGHPMDPRAKGPNSLIRSSALLVENAGDILDALETRLRTPLSDPTKELFDMLPGGDQEVENMEKARETVKDLLGQSPTPIDEIVRLSGLTTGVVLTILLELELAGLAKRHPGNKASL